MNIATNTILADMLPLPTNFLNIQFLTHSRRQLKCEGF
jgi:hypothetical protein